MDRYSRGYNDRYRGYYSRPRSDAYRPNDGYRPDRDYRDPGGRNHSPNPHYSSSRSPARDGYPKDHRYSYSETRGYPAHYSSPNSPPSRSSSRSPRRPSYGYYHSPSAYSYNSRRSPSPVGMVSRSGSISRRDSYDHRPYQGSPSYPYPPYRYPPYPSRRPYSGPPPSYPPPPGYRPSSGYHSREPSSSSMAPPQRSTHSTPSFTAPHSPKGPLTTPNTTSESPASSTAPPSIVSTPNIHVKVNTPPATQPSAPSSSSVKYSPPVTSNASKPPSYPSSSIPKHHNAPYHHYHHGSHYNSYVSSRSSSPLPVPPIKQRISWAPEQENELERYHAEQGKLHDEEDKILSSVRKSRFELEFASWDTSKLERQLELVQTQWEENGMEELIKQELAAKLSGKLMPVGRSSPLAIS